MFRNPIRLAVLIVTLLVGSVAWPADEDAAKKKPAGESDRAALEKQFQETLSGATLVGRFTIEGQKGAPKEEKYTIEKVSKLRGDLWLFAARIQYGEHDVTVPLPIEVKWAGDTPVITVTDLGVPGLGAYTARVVVYKDQYAGTWSGKDHGGHLFGKVVKKK